MQPILIFAQAKVESIETWVKHMPLIIMAMLGALLFFSIVISILKCYKACPSSKILVKSGLGSGSRTAQTIHGGGAFVIPIFQTYSFLSLEPLQIEVPLKGALSAENIRVNVPSVFTVAIGTEPEIMQNAAIRLLGLRRDEVNGQASDIIFGQMRQVIASMRIEEINRDRDKFLDSVQISLEPELRKIGLVLLNVNITDITDDSGYIEAIGRKAASAAVQQAVIDVAEQEKKGAIGVAMAKQEKSIEVANAQRAEAIGTKAAERERMVQVADLDREEKVGIERALAAQEVSVREAQRDMRIQTAEADAVAIDGENQAKGKIAASTAELQVRQADADAKSTSGGNLAKAKVAQSNAELAVKQAEAFQLGETRKREAEAAVKEAQFRAEAKAALAQAEKVEAEQRAALEAPAKAQKSKIVVDAEAAAERRRIEAEGEAKAIFARLEAEARGQYEILSKKAEGLGEIVSACGGANEAFQLLMLEHMGQLSETAAKAISNIKFDKVIVWENGGANGHGATANFLQNMSRSLPPMMQIMQEIGGVRMPEYFGQLAANKENAAKTGPEVSNGEAPKAEPSGASPTA